MTTEHRTTKQEQYYGQLLGGKEGVLSGAVRTVIGEAESAAYDANLVRSYSFQPEEYEEAMEKMRLAATELSDSDQELLAKVWRAALAAAASIDPDDRESIVGYRVYSGNLHWYYRMLSGMVEDTLSEKRRLKMEAECRKALAEGGPENIPF